MDRSAVVVQVIAMLGTILALVGVGAFGEALNTLLLLQNLLTIAIAYDRYNKSQSKHYFLRKDLLFPLDSPYWKVLNNEGSEYGYRVLLRTNKAAFDLICANVDPDFMLWRDGYQDGDGRKRRGRPNMLDGRSAIAMTIAWLGSDAKSNRLLQMTFGGQSRKSCQSGLSKPDFREEKHNKLASLRVLVARTQTRRRSIGRGSTIGHHCGHRRGASAGVSSVPTGEGGRRRVH